jgi:hypothetical protein
VVEGLDFKFVVNMCGPLFGWDKQWSSASDVNPAWPSTIPLFSTPLTTPSLHFVADADPLKAACEAHTTLYTKPEVVHFDSAHRPPTQEAANLAFVAFCRSQVYYSTAP